MRGLGIPFASKKACARYLSPIVRHTSGAGASTSAGASSCRRGRDDLLVEVGERHDEPHVVLGDEPRQRRDVARVVDARNEGPVMSVVERRRQGIEVGGDRGRARPSEGAHDVDALAGAGEEDRRHLDVGG